MTYEVEDFQKEKKKLRIWALSDIIVILVFIGITLACYYTHQTNVSVFFGVMSGLAGQVLILVGAERLELNSYKKAETPI